MTQRNNIEIDYCPSCRGVWLDKGELDKMLEYADQPASYGQNNNQRPYLEPRPYDNPKHYYYNKPHKKRSFLGDLFDFD
jgi:Zn-finger nucleic acid-binding protein